MITFKLISFVGPSGSGKSTAAQMAETILKEKNALVIRRDVATPLREIQKASYKLFNRPDPGSADSETFLQDPSLLAFLAKHFEPYLGYTFANKIKTLQSEASEFIYDKRVVIINADCRNNSYQALLDLGFEFIRINTEADIRKLRLMRRDGGFVETSVDATDQIKTEIIVNNNGTLSELNDRINTVVSDILTN